MSLSPFYKFRINNDISDELVELLLEYPYELWNWLTQLILPKKRIDRIWDADLIREFIHFLNSLPDEGLTGPNLKRKIIEYHEKVFPNEKISPSKYLKKLEEKKLVREANGVYYKTPFYDMFITLLNYYLDLHKETIKNKQLYEYFLSLKEVKLTPKQLMRWHTEGLFFLYLIKNSYYELTWIEMNRLWKEFTKKYSNIKIYLSNLRFLNLFISLKVLEKIPPNNLYKLNSILIEKLYVLVGKVVFQLVLFLKMLELNIYLPKKHYELHLRANDVEVYLTSNAKKIVYDRVSESKESIKLLLLATLVGDDEESKKALAKPLINKVKLNSMVYFIPMPNSKDDNEIRKIDQAGGVLKVILNEVIDFAPLAILDKKEVYYTPIQFMTESLSPIMAIKIQDKKAVNMFLKEWEFFWRKSPIYEDFMDALKYVYAKYHDKEMIEIPKNSLLFLQKYALLDKNGNITKLGEIILFERVYPG